MLSKRERVWRLAFTLMDKEGLIDKGWSFQFMKKKNWWGWCCEKTKVIGIDKTHLDQLTMKQIREVILHEIAHALTIRKIEKLGRKDFHGEIWANECIRLGIEPNKSYYFLEEMNG